MFLYFILFVILIYLLIKTPDTDDTPLEHDTLRLGGISTWKIEKFKCEICKKTKEEMSLRVDWQPNDHAGREYDTIYTCRECALEMLKRDIFRSKDSKEHVVERLDELIKEASLIND